MHLNDNDRQGLEKSFRNLTMFTSKLAEVEVEDVPAEIDGRTIYGCNH